MQHYHKYEERIKAQGCGKPYIRFNVCECGDKQYIGPSKAIQPHTYEVNKRLKEPSCTEEGEDEQQEDEEEFEQVHGFDMGMMM